MRGSVASAAAGRFGEDDDSPDDRALLLALAARAARRAAATVEGIPQAGLVSVALGLDTSPSRTPPPPVPSWLGDVSERRRAVHGTRTRPRDYLTERSEPRRPGIGPGTSSA